ncbi:hypothetical protein Dsin_021711 [Dipteronia sinensis]|uniref:Zinc finger PMZ-type domain-containing protein n=1 Tax=Dipteronia sinensis TaxID=43782 RepID=A0AAE0DZA4_9ROSI|nr:hypothetical protein Dsin_021711 [Dipteronia sinensis]
MYCYIEYSGNYTYQVRARGEDQFVVDIDNITLACNKWQLIEIPCMYGMTVLLSSNRNPINFIDSKYKKETFIKAYTLIIHGINGPIVWPKTNGIPLQCPDFKTQKGMPKKKSNLHSNENSDSDGSRQQGAFPANPSATNRHQNVMPTLLKCWNTVRHMWINHGPSRCVSSTRSVQSSSEDPMALPRPKNQDLHLPIPMSYQQESWGGTIVTLPGTPPGT